VIYSGRISKEEIFVSDGACSDIGRLQMLFGPKVSVAVQDPTYPLYLEGSILQGVQTIVRMPCLPENDFFPKLETLPRTDLIYFCSPNNPTGAAATKKQLEALVGWAKGHRSVILFDNVYSFFIQDSNLPKSIYDISGAEDVAIETSSYSKMVGFTGVRLGWTVVPERLKYEDGTSVRADWQRLVTTIFNGASNISQRGGLAVLEPQGIKETKQLIVEYLDNAKLLKRALEKLASQGFDCKVFGGVHAPYLWTFFKGRKSWDVFQEFLEECHILTIPGVGFGQAGEGFVRFSALSKRQHIEEAIDRLLKK
ncbi:MAG: LL-diaminopimelate aminotransferase, partial [Anaerolineae bacterium]